MSAFTLLVGGRACSIPVEGSETLLQAIYLSGLVEPPSLCTGLGRCGRCRVRFESGAPPELPGEDAVLAPEALAQGWRLSCRRPALAGARLELPPGIPPAAEAPAPPQAGLCAGDAPLLGLAVDFGTTSLHFAAVHGEAPGHAGHVPPQNIPPGGIPPEGVWINPQMGAGADVLSRLAYALNPEGGRRLGEISRLALRRMTEEVEARHGQVVREICLAANTAMTCLALGRAPDGLAGAPYTLDYAGGAFAELPGLPPVWVAPLAAPFIGGDVAAGYAALALGGEPVAYPFILADLGTNGECLLALSPQEALAASLPLGPALEGAGMRCGSEARPGVIVGFTLAPGGLEPVLFPAEEAPARPLEEERREEACAGISGSGYMALVRRLLQAGLVRPDGAFASSGPHAPLARRLAGRLRVREGERVWEISTSPPLYLASSDIEELLKIRAAFSLVLQSLLQAASLRFADIRALYLAGSLGSHAHGDDLEGLAFIPPGESAKLRIAGNTSLAGAALLLRRPELRPVLVRWAARVKTLSLPDQPDFLSRFAREMHF